MAGRRSADHDQARPEQNLQRGQDQLARPHERLQQHGAAVVHVIGIRGAGRRRPHLSRRELPHGRGHGAGAAARAANGPQVAPWQVRRAAVQLQGAQRRSVGDRHGDAAGLWLQRRDVPHHERADHGSRPCPDADRGCVHGLCFVRRDHYRCSACWVHQLCRPASADEPRRLQHRRWRSPVMDAGSRVSVRRGLHLSPNGCLHVGRDIGAGWCIRLLRPDLRAIMARCRHRRHVLRLLHHDAHCLRRREPE